MSCRKTIFITLKCLSVYHNWMISCALSFQAWVCIENTYVVANLSVTKTAILRKRRPLKLILLML